jgi:E3 SUMO-protein ligase PIAS1
MPIEYPSVPDVYVDDYPIPFKERGLRGKAGSAPPFDLDKSSKGLQRINGRMTSITFGHTGPTTGKKKEISKVGKLFHPVQI